ncbi:membrane-associated oxidoreductase [Streptomyces sp. NPDC006879]|uniref:membrane-associated oxidoreductase n=1 Tax=Streptomyces sp. NPDC006879 TaxID=3364767 RepID=UPI0036CA2544
MEFNDLTPAERRIWEAFPRGEGVDFRESSDEDPGEGASWGPERTVRAKVLRSLLLGSVARPGEVAGLKLKGARVTGTLDLKYATVEHPVRMRSCHFERPPDLYGSQLRALVLTGSVLPGLTAGTIRVDVVLRLSCCRIAGPVRLAGARLSGFFLNDAELGVPAPVEDPEVDPEAAQAAHTTEPALQLNHAEIATDLWAAGLVAHGQVRINGAVVAGQVNLDDAELHTPRGTALHAETLSVGTDLRAMRLRAHGRVNLSGARIPGQLNLAYARLSYPGGQALRASSCVIGELWLREASPIQGAVNLRRTQVDLLHVPQEVWPESVHIDGLTYRSLAPSMPAVQRLPLLEREESGYLPYAYEQLAASYRTVGDEDGARTVQLAKLRRLRRTLPPHTRLWGVLQDATVGYGFRPLRAAVWLTALLLIGAVAFALNPPPPLKADEAPGFNPVFYTLDLMLPIIGFGQESAFAPRGGYQWLSYLLIVAGWLLATTTAAGISRALRRR